MASVDLGQTVSLGSLASGIFKMHLKELQFLMKAGLTRSQGAEALLKAMLHAGRSKPQTSEMCYRLIVAGTGVSKQNST